MPYLDKRDTRYVDINTTQSDGPDISLTLWRAVQHSESIGTNFRSFIPPIFRNRERDRERQRERDRQTDRQREGGRRETDKQRQTDRETETERDMY